MGQGVLKKTNFYFNFYENKGIHSIYSSIHLRNNTQPIYSKPLESANDTIHTLAVELFPTYLNFKINKHYDHSFKKIFRVKGHCISLEQFEDTESYLRKHFKPNFRTSMRRRLKGLEKCFDIEYKMFYGQITREEYDLIMHALHAMLTRRFNQRNDENLALKRWDDYYTSTFDLINTQRASLFVIYDGVKPIQISLSYHYDNILFLSIPSYDIDYAKFGLGNISILKILEWCLSHKCKILDMGFGAFDYKIKWCNETYDFEHHLFYKKFSNRSRLLVFLISRKTQLINYLISKRVNIYYHQIKTFFIGRKKSGVIGFSKEMVNVNSIDLDQCEIIDPITNNSFAFLRGAIYDFLYLCKEHRSKIKVYEFEKDQTFFLKVENQVQKLTR